MERDGGREDDPRLSSSETVYSTPANGENIVLTHMSKRVYATFAYFFTVAEWIFAIAAFFQIISSQFAPRSLLCYTSCFSRRFYTYVVRPAVLYVRPEKARRLRKCGGVSLTLCCTQYYAPLAANRHLKHLCVTFGYVHTQLP